MIFLSPEALLSVLAVLVLDLATRPVLARLPLPPGPPVAIARVSLFLSRRLDRPNRSPDALRLRGFLLVVLMGGLAIALGVGLDGLTHRIPDGFLLRALVLWSCLRVARPFGRLWEGARRVGAGADSSGFARGVLEQTAVSFVYFVVTPVFWYLLAGLPGLLLAATGWALERSAADGPGGAFGEVPRLFERMVAWAPSRIAELILALAAFAAPQGHPTQALRQAWARRIRGELRPVAALAGGLGVALAGPSRETPQRSWVGVGTARIDRHDILRAMWLYAASLLIFAGLLAALAFTIRYSPN